MSTIPSRQREVITVSVDDPVEGRTILEAYNNALPEEVLYLLMEQAITLRLEGFDEDNREERWHGPNEQVQGLLCKGSAAVPLEEGE